MRKLLPVLMLLTLIQPVAADDAKPNTLTAKEIADGWVLLFDGETTFGWKLEGDGQAAVDKGLVTVTGGNSDKTHLTFSTQLGDGELRFNYRVEQPERKSLVSVQRKSTTHPATMVFELAEVKAPNWGEAKITIQGNVGVGEFKGPNAGPEQRAELPTTIPSVQTIWFWVSENSNLTLQNVRFKPAGLKSIFNGKDLTGWKEIPGKKSKFAVTSEGWLNVKDGNGDLQTEGQWDDFVLQMDIISNGDHLNSGVFFRALPGEFWSGYEAQVRNEWVTELVLKDGTKLMGSATDEKDSVKLKLATVQGKSVRVGRETRDIPKKDIEQRIEHRDLPIDFGSGGVYNRQTARKVVSTDREWYTMTVIAHGNHIATWVNGYPVADFTDSRPANKSARNGTKVDKGVISLQGHDPTTDLSFRNIRIAELPRAGKP